MTRRMPTQDYSPRKTCVCVTLCRDMQTGHVIVLAPDCEEIDGKLLDHVWDAGWRPREYDQGRVVLVRIEA
jgi:hypothetical protein